MNNPRDPRQPGDEPADATSPGATPEGERDEADAPALSDASFEAYLAGDSELSQAYHAQPPQWPGSELDALIQAEARKPLGANAEQATRGWRWSALLPQRWWQVASAAAVVSLCAALVLELTSQPVLTPEAQGETRWAPNEDKAAADGAAQQTVADTMADASRSGASGQAAEQSKKQLADSRLAPAPPAVAAGPRRTRSRERREEDSVRFAVASDPAPVPQALSAPASGAEPLAQAETEQAPAARQSNAPPQALEQRYAAAPSEPAFAPAPARQPVGRADTAPELAEVDIDSGADPAMAKSAAQAPQPLAPSGLAGRVWAQLSSQQQHGLAALIGDGASPRGPAGGFAVADASIAEPTPPASNRALQSMSVQAAEDAPGLHWIDIIEQAIDAGETDLARATLAAFKEVYPETPVSDKIRDFEQALDRPAP